MNKDFFTKPISLKDIDLKNIDFSKLKNIKNKKEIVIGILILIYIIAIIVIGSFLLNERSEVKATFESKEIRYNSLKNGLSEEALRGKIEEAELEKDRLSNVMSEIKPGEFENVLNEFKKGSALTWDSQNQEISLRPDSKEYPDYDIYVVNIKSFSSTFEEVENFLEYVDNYDRIVRIDSISIKENKITGKMGGQLRLSFYFKKLSE